MGQRSQIILLRKEDDGEIKTGVHGDSDVTEKWNEWKANKH